MTKPNAAIFATFLVSVIIVLGGAALVKGGFYIGKHEGDTLHLLQMVIRMGAGDWPHLDFVTPIGVLAFAPIALFLKLGFGAGHAILMGQILVALVFLPAIWWVSISRFRGPWAYLFGAGLLVLILALVHGETERSVSISMHYNRWSWAAAFLAISAALIPEGDRKHQAADGWVIGLAMAALVLCKVTYFVAFVVPVLVALIGRGAFKTLGWAVLAGLLPALLVTALAGPQFWLAYLHDLAMVAGSDIRPQPGLALASVIGAPAYMVGSLILILCVVFLRQAGKSLEGLVLLLLVPGFFYVTYQNFGNDPQWLGLLGVLMMAFRPSRELRNGLGWNVQKAVGLSGLVALTLAAPSYTNLFYSPFRHLAAKAVDYTPLIPGSGVHEDILSARVRTLQVDGKVPLDGADTFFAAVTDPDLREDATVFQGETLPDCSLELGMIAWFTAVSKDLSDSGYATGKTVFSADLLSSYWMYGAFRPLAGGAPWYYGGLPGFEDADYLIVPLCPLSQRVRQMVLKAVQDTGQTMTEVRRTSEYILFEK